MFRGRKYRGFAGASFQPVLSKMINGGVQTLDLTGSAPTPAARLIERAGSDGQLDISD